MNNTLLLFYSAEPRSQVRILIYRKWSIYINYSANNHGTFTLICEYLIMHFLQGFSEIFLQQWSGYFCQTVFGAVVFK